MYIFVQLQESIQYLQQLNTCNINDIYQTNFLSPIGLWLYRDASALLMPFGNGQTLLELVNTMISTKSGNFKQQNQNKTMKYILNCNSCTTITVLDQEYIAVYLLNQVFYNNRKHFNL